MPCISPMAAGSPSVAVRSPPVAVGSPPVAVGSPLEGVGSPPVAAGSPLEGVGPLPGDLRPPSLASMSPVCIHTCVKIIKQFAYSLFVGIFYVNSINIS